jgi:hypothetical protein
MAGLALQGFNNRPAYFTGSTRDSNNSHFGPLIE